MQRTVAARVEGGGGAGPEAGVLDPARHVARRQEHRLVRVDDRAAGRQRRRERQQPPQLLGLAGPLPRPERLLEQPQAHDVAQVADPAVDAGLVREVRRAALLAEHRRPQLDADERPRPARDVGEARPAGRDRDDRRRGVVRADVGHGRPRREAGLLGDLVADRSEQRARPAQRREEAPVVAQRLDQVPRPLPRRRVEQPGRRGVRLLGGGLAGQPVAEQVRDEEHRPGPGERLRAGERGQLVERVERQELDAGPLVEARLAGPLVDEVGAGRVAGVAVVPRIGDEHAVAVEQPEVDAPRVDADARGRLRLAPGGGAQPVEDLAVQPQDVPVEAVGQPDRLVGEAVDLVETQLPRAHPADDDPAARRADIDRDDRAGGGTGGGAHRPHRRPSSATVTAIVTAAATATATATVREVIPTFR